MCSLHTYTVRDRIPLCDVTVDAQALARHPPNQTGKSLGKCGKVNRHGRMVRARRATISPDRPLPYLPMGLISPHRLWK